MAAGPHYDWLSGYIAARGLSLAIRALMAFLTMSYIVCLVALLSGTDGPRASIPVVMTWIACAGGVAGLALWAWRWPTRADHALVHVANALLAHTDGRGC